jgi:hypothetical protein
VALPEQGSGERSSPEILQRELGRLIAAALRAVFDVPSGFKSTTNDSETGSISNPKYGRQLVVAA